MKWRCLSLALLSFASCQSVQAADISTDWWKAPGSLASKDAQWRAKYLQQKEDADAFAAELQKSQKSGRALGYLEQGGVSPSWYSAPIQVQPFPEPYSAKLYDLAYSAFLQSHRLQDAYRLAYTAVQQRPDDVIWRQRLIRVAGWLGQRNEVLRQWHWLAEHGDQQAIGKTVQLAVSLSRPDLVVKLLGPAARAGQLKEKEWKSLIFAYGELGEPEQALADIDIALKRAGLRSYLLQQKAYLSYQMGAIQESLEALQSSARLYGSSPSLAVEEARLLSMQGEYHLAFAAMEKVHAQATLEDVPFWRLYAVLAWEIHNNPAAFQAEKTLYLLGAANEYDLQRLVVLSSTDQLGAALSVAEYGWRHYHLPWFYFESLYNAGQSKEWSVLGKLLSSVSAKDPDGLRNYAAYWMAMGQWANARKDYTLAGQAYAEILHRNPDDDLAQNDLLWMLIDNRQTRILRALLAGNVLRPPTSLREAVLNALELLERSRQALLLTNLSSPASANHPQNLLNRASLWDSAGYSGLAWSLRRQAARKSLESLAKSPVVDERQRP